MAMLTIPSCSSSDNVEETHSRLQTVNAEALKMNNSGLAVEVFCVSDITGKFLNTGKAIPSMQDFLAKCKFVSDKLELVVRAVDAITEVCFFPSKYQL